MLRTCSLQPLVSGNFRVEEAAGEMPTDTKTRCVVLFLLPSLLLHQLQMLWTSSLVRLRVAPVKLRRHRLSAYPQSPLHTSWQQPQNVMSPPLLAAAAAAVAVSTGGAAGVGVRLMHFSTQLSNCVTSTCSPPCCCCCCCCCRWCTRCW
jgi:hypothetical protein